MAQIDGARLEQFVGQAVGDMAAAISGLLVHLGDRLGLYQAMADAGPVTPEVLADRTGRAAVLGVRRLFRPSYAAHLTTTWIPALDGVEAKLRPGANVADVGCGLGASTIIMAEAYSRSTFAGYDYHEPSIEAGRKSAADAGAGRRVRFETASATSFPGTGFDLICLCDCPHDMGDPVGAARHIRRALAGDGTLMLVEPHAGDALEDNLNPVGRAFYGLSTVICTPASLAQPVGLGLGAQAGQARLTEVLTEAGFSRVRRATETPFNLILEARP